MPTPTLSLEQVRATPLGKKPVIEELTAMVDHSIEQESRITTSEERLDVIDGGLPAITWPTAADTKYSIEETSGNPNNYTAAIAGASASLDLIEGLAYWLHGSVTNTTVCTLNVGSRDGTMPVRKKTPDGIVELESGEMPSFGAQLYYSNANATWVLINPTITGITHHVTNTLGVAADYVEGEFIYVIEQ